MSYRARRLPVLPSTAAVFLASVVSTIGITLCSLVVGVAPATAGEGPWIPPLDAPIVDPFRPPVSRYGAGNRGLEYGATSGQSVTAVDDGRVVFAGRVGNARHITVDHGSGLRSTYAFVESINVVRGQTVRQGQVVASGGPGFHLTARLGDEYIDPELLFAGYTVQLRLTEGPLPGLDQAVSNVWSVDGWDQLVIARAEDTAPAVLGLARWVR